jgi:hypothetical protein
MKFNRLLITSVWSIACLACGLALAADPKPATLTSLTIVDAAGETVTLKSATLTAGVRRLAWLAEPNGTTDDAKKGPLAFEMREPNSTTFVNGILTLVPVSSIASCNYDYEKKTMNLKVAGVETPLEGSIEYVGFNALGLDADVDQGKAGVAAVKYRGGNLKGGGIRSLTFKDPKPWERKPLANPLTWIVQVADARAKNPILTVMNLQPLYRFPDGTEKIIGTLPFQKTLKLPWVDIRSLKLEPPMMKGQAAEMVVANKDGKEQTLSPMTTLEIDGKKATLLGLIGEVSVGYKLIPLHTIQELKMKLIDER